MLKIFDNIEIKLICLFLAIVMWLYANKPEGIDNITAAITGDDQGRITFHEVPVELKPTNSQKQWGANPSEISLEVKCSAAEVKISKFRAIVKLTQENEEEGRINLTAKNIELPKGLIFMKAEPSEIEINPML